ncbi:MAG: hypothetical protein M4579_000607 [Chaenotheca gracillima]|nr:MAG: hypothetical protein M4579_000607 [Chaenotheca gracillima]
MAFTPKIAIIGAGPSGLTLALMLQRNDIPCTIYDLESGPSARNQGGTLDLHGDSGQRALRAVGLIDEFYKKARPEGDAMKLITTEGKVLVDENLEVDEPARPIEEVGRPEIDRIVLRGMLLDALDTNRISWGKKLLRVEPAKNDTYDLHFAQEILTGFDLVVGADGAWSKVRPLLTDVSPHYSGISMIELWALDADTRENWLSQYVGKGSCFMFDEGRAVLSQRNGNGSIRTYACVRQPETWIQDCGIDFTKPDQARTQLVDQYFADCANEVKREILDSRDELIPRTLYMLPVGLTWDSRPGLTLLGDAAHLMTPFAGAGVNAAMHDALELGNAIIACKNGGELDRLDGVHDRLAAAVKNYQASMFLRSAKDTAKTWKQTHICFSKGGGEILMDIMGKGGPPSEEGDAETS